EIVAPALGERSADACAELARGAARVRDDEDRVDVEPAIAYRAHEPPDEHGRLAGARAGRDEDLAGRLDRCQLLLVHARGTRQIDHRSHHAGQSPPFGSWRTSPTRMRWPSERAVSRARSTAAQNDSSS